MKIKIIIPFVICLAGCADLEYLWRGSPPVPVTAAEYNETEYQVLVSQVAQLRATKSTLDAQCRALHTQVALENAGLNQLPPTWPPRTPIVANCASVDSDLRRAEEALARQETARYLFQRQNEVHLADPAN